jgi:hypothetical protein
MITPFRPAASIMAPAVSAAPATIIAVIVISTVTVVSIDLVVVIAVFVIPVLVSAIIAVPLGACGGTDTKRRQHERGSRKYSGCFHINILSVLYDTGRLDEKSQWMLNQIVSNDTGRWRCDVSRPDTHLCSNHAKA